MDPNITKDKAPEVPFAVHEASLAFAREVNRRLVAVLILVLILFFLSNAAWLWAWTSYDYVSDTVTVESTAGHANFIGANGDIYNGESSVQEEAENP